MNIIKVDDDNIADDDEFNGEWIPIDSDIEQYNSQEAIAGDLKTESPPLKKHEWEQGGA